MKRFNVTNIRWETDGETVPSLPTEAIVETEHEDDVANVLSDEHGWLINSLEATEIPNPTNL